jgi:hypothetical protein
VFAQVHHRDFAMISMEKKTELPSCRPCTKLVQLLNVEKDARQMRAINAVLLAHRQRAHYEWLWDRAFLALAKAPDSQVLYMMLDGSPGSTFPHHPGGTVPQVALKFHFITVEVDGADKYKRRGVYVLLDELLHAVGCDAWCTVLLMEIVRYLQLPDRPRPRYLVIHTDNTVRLSHALAHSPCVSPRTTRTASCCAWRRCW